MRPRSRVRALVVSMAVVAAAGGLTVAAQPATAQTAGSCTGHVTKTRDIKAGSTLIGQTIVYYQPGSGGTNTACLYHRGPAYGASSYTRLQLGRCYGTDCTYAFDDPNFMRDAGNFAKLAGPVRVTQTDGDCVVAEGYFVYKGRSYDAGTGKVGCP